MSKWPVALLALTALLPPALAQPPQGVTEAERAHAGMMLLVLMVGGMIAVFGLLWWLRKQGKLPEEKPQPRPRWVHPEDEDRG